MYEAFARRAAGVSPNAITYSACISACARHSDWREATTNFTLRVNCVFAFSFVVASLFLVVRPGAPSSVLLLLVAMPGAPSSVLAPAFGLHRKISPI